MLDTWQNSSYQIHALTKTCAASIQYSFPAIERGDHAKTNACIDMSCPWQYNQKPTTECTQLFANLSLPREPCSICGWSTPTVLARSCHWSLTHQRTMPCTVNESLFPRLCYAFAWNGMSPTVIEIRACKVKPGSASCFALDRGIGYQ